MLAPFVPIKHPLNFEAYGDGDLRVLVSRFDHPELGQVVHASVSRPRGGSAITFADLMRVKDAFGAEREALQVFPRRSEYRDVAGAHGIDVYHLWVLGPGASLRLAFTEKLATGTDL